MGLDRYRLLKSLGFSQVGEAYRAEFVDRPESVELWLLHRDRCPDERWNSWCRRWRLAALLESPTARAIVDLNLAAPQPYLAKADWPAQTLSDRASARERSEEHTSEL